MDVRLARGTINLSFLKVDCRRGEKKVLCILAARSNFLHDCLYPQELMFSLLQGGFCPAGDREHLGKAISLLPPCVHT